MKNHDPGVPTVVMLDDPPAVAREGARRVQVAAAAAIAGRGAFHWALAGGSTPGKLYETLATAPYRAAIDWNRTQVFFGDERCVPAEHPQSNYGMVRATLLDLVEIPPGNVHRMRGEVDPASAAAAAYEQELLRPLDLALLGIGPDGHTASLFPGGAALGETVRACVPVEAPAIPPRVGRLTLTIPVFMETREILFLVTGAEKADILHEVVRGPDRPLDVPSQAIARRQRPVVILCDRGAAAGLTSAR